VKDRELEKIIDDVMAANPKAVRRVNL